LSRLAIDFGCPAIKFVGGIENAVILSSKIAIMKLNGKKIATLLCTIVLTSATFAQEGWPKELPAADGTVINVYQPEPETLKGHVLTYRAAISVREKGATDLVFGTFWASAVIATDRDSREVEFTSLTVSDIRVPQDSASDRLDYIKSVIQSQFPAAAGTMPLDGILTSLNQEMDQSRLSASLNIQPPVILYSKQPSVLVTIDGTPRLEENHKWGLDVVVNTPFTIVKDKDGPYYCWGGGHWYSAAAATGPYSPLAGKPDRRLRRIEEEYKKSEPDSVRNAVDSIVPAIIVTTSPAELIQTNGTPNLLPIQGTSLLYVGNTPDNIFVDTKSQLYYILLSGRWYKSGALESGNGWTFVASDQLPADFAAIPEGSPKDNVLASVAGTSAAREAVMDAQVPQTARVDRNNASVEVQYDGTPQFQSIAGTQLQYAVNTPATVLYDTHHYFALDNGIWFVSDNAGGPWAVSTVRPDDLNEVPPSCPVYNAKFVDIYDITPDYIYMGYTPGYLSNFVFGPTVVYGTGFYYSPWIGRHYYPRPWSWGFDMLYSPWYGWGFGFDYNLAWFNFGLDWDGWYWGWWGPGAYYPFCWGWGFGYWPHSFYGRGLEPGHRFHMYAHNNLYYGRSGVRGHDEFGRGYSGGEDRRGGTVRGGGALRGGGSAFTDRRGNVFQRDERGQWQNRSGRGDVRPNGPGLEQQRQMQERGAFRAASFQRAQSVGTPHFGGFRGGGGFHGGGGGGRR
jgi:hypothetical protein